MLTDTVIEGPYLATQTRSQEKNKKIFSIKQFKRLVFSILPALT